MRFEPPSRYIIRKALQLGQKMAQRERRIRPDLRDARQYPSFQVFRQLHRYRLGQLDAILPWEAQLQKLIEREASGRRIDLNNTQHWDEFVSQVEGPIHSAFWYGWELVVQLEQCFEQARTAEIRRATKRQVLHVAAHPESPKASVLQSNTDEAQWESLADRLFEVMKIGETDEFWDMPDPEKIGAQPRPFAATGAARPPRRPRDPLEA